MRSFTPTSINIKATSADISPRSQIIIQGGKQLIGEIDISGAKNATLPIMAASLLTDEPLVLSNVPRLTDVCTMSRLLEDLGSNVEYSRDDTSEAVITLTISTPHVVKSQPSDELSKTIRNSCLVLGPLLARTGKVTVHLPGGCHIGRRPIDLHLMALSELGANIVVEDKYVIATAPDGLVGTNISFPFASVGATENAIMAATLADGVTVLKNCAREPEIVDLVKLLVSMGAVIQGEGTDTITINGVDKLHGCEHRIIPDRIEAGSFACAAAITGGDVLLKGITDEYLKLPFGILKSTGVSVNTEDGGVRVKGKPTRGCDVTTSPYPGFPTDLQAHFMTLFSVTPGCSIVNETIFENRFQHVQQLVHLGAEIKVDGSTATVHGVESLTGSDVIATDLRASMSLVIAGLAATGETKINEVRHLDRGYACLEHKLSRVGAVIMRHKT